MNVIAFKVPIEYLSDVKKELSDNNISYDMATSKGFTGVELATFLLEIGKVGIPTVAYVIVGLYKAKKIINLKIGNSTINTNIDNLEEIKKILRTKVSE